MEKAEVTSTKSFRINNFDLLRLLAATEVIVDHYLADFHIPVSNFGLKILYLFPGVPVFFIISGYLISASYERNNNLRTYFRNRALRIFPGLWGCIIVTIIAISITGISFVNKQTVLWLPTQLVGFIYTPHFLANYGIGSYNGSLWTIPIELQFYIMLPVCYLLARGKKSNYVFYGLLALFIILNILCTESNFGPKINKLITYTFIPHFYMFLSGVILQRLQLYKSTLIDNKALYWGVAYIAFSLLLQEYMNLTLFLILKSLLLAFFILSLAYTLPQTAAKLLRSNDISYGIYLYHGLLLTIIVQEKWTNRVNVFEIMLLACILGYFSWLLIERPAIQSKKKALVKR